MEAKKKANTKPAPETGNKDSAKNRIRATVRFLLGQEKDLQRKILIISQIVMTLAK